MIASPKPLLSASTSANSNFDLLVTYWDGRYIYWKDMGGTSNYAFKPGRPTGVNSNTIAEVATYPNPVSDVLNITQGSGAEFTVTDMLGRMLNIGKLDTDKATISTKNLTPGNYILHLSKDGYREQVKFVKQ